MTPAAALAATPKDTLVIATSIDDIVSIDPAEAFEFSGGDLLQNTYDRLVELDPKDLSAGYVPGLAASWKVSEDGLTYTRSEGRRVGNECVRTCKSRWWRVHYKKNKK